MEVIWSNILLKTQLISLLSQVSEGLAHDPSGKPGSKLNHPHCKFLLFSFKSEFPLLELVTVATCLSPVHLWEDSGPIFSITLLCLGWWSGPVDSPNLLFSRLNKLRYLRHALCPSPPNHLSGLLVDLLQFINISFTWWGSKQDMVPQMRLHKFQAEGCKHFPT